MSPDAWALVSAQLDSAATVREGHVMCGSGMHFQVKEGAGEGGLGAYGDIELVSAQLDSTATVREGHVMCGSGMHFQVGPGGSSPFCDVRWGAGELWNMAWCRRTPLSTCLLVGSRRAALRL